MSQENSKWNFVKSILKRKPQSQGVDLVVKAWNLGVCWPLRSQVRNFFLRSQVRNLLGVIHSYKPSSYMLSFAQTLIGLLASGWWNYASKIS